MVAGRLEHFAQPSDVYVHSTLFDEYVIAPHLVKELGAGIDAIVMCHEEVKQAELGRTQRKCLAVGGHPVARRIQLESFGFDRVIRDLRRAAS